MSRNSFENLFSQSTEKLRRGTFPFFFYKYSVIEKLHG